jgi:hypothetical protein
MAHVKKFAVVESVRGEVSIIDRVDALSGPLGTAVPTKV